MQRGLSFFWGRENRVPMQRGTHFAIFDGPFGSPCWAQRGRQKIYKINAFLLMFKMKGAMSGLRMHPEEQNLRNNLRK